MQLTKLNLKFEAVNDSLLPGQLGSMLRGIFGEALMQYDEKLYNFSSRSISRKSRL